MNKLIHVHYLTLPSQGNIYSLAVLNSRSGLDRFIVASLKREIFSFDINKDASGVLKPIVKEIICSYVSSGSEIIAIDAFKKSLNCDDYHIGITVSKLNPVLKSGQLLNIYSEQDLKNKCENNIESTAQCLLVEPLKFCPYMLTHTFLPDETGECNSGQAVWLLSCSDKKIHAYQEDYVLQNHTYKEVDVSLVFPELSNPPGIVMWLDIHYSRKLARRVTVMGCECGLIQLSVVNTKTKSVLCTYTDVFICTISQVLLFTLSPKDITLPRCTNKKVDNYRKFRLNDDDDLHLLACSTEEHSAVYMNVLEGLSEKQYLEGSDLYDACLCGTIVDINMDGCNELLLGTYGQEILMYTWNGEVWKLADQRSTEAPIHSMHYLDFVGDGVGQLVVQTLSGVHILQHDPEVVCQIIKKRLKEAFSEDTEPREVYITTEHEILTNSIKEEDISEVVIPTENKNI